MNRIKQACVAHGITFFKNEFLQYNNLEDYSDIYAPTLFFGATECNRLINNHKGYKIILPCTPFDIPIIEDYSNTFFICAEDFPLPENTIKKSFTPRIKNYDLFKPNVLGDKIYTYSGFKNGWNKLSKTIKQIQNQIDYEIITTDHVTIKDYLSFDKLKSDFYDKCFLNINLTQGHGLGTGIEMGLMGRKTVFAYPNERSFQRIRFPCFIDYLSVQDTVKIINEEAKKIGTIQESIDPHNVGEEWLDLDFWLK